MRAVRLLGEVTAHVGGREVELGPARQRCVLAALAVDAGRVVAVDRLVDRVWAPDVPRRARATLQSYVSRLRQVLAGQDGLDIERRPGGYVLLAEETDLRCFRDLCARARGAADGATAARVLAEALAMWRGEALTGLDSEWARAERDQLHQERLAAEHDLVDARLRAGHGEELLAVLSARVAEHPLDERVAGQYMVALSRAGRSADALAHYRRLRARLVEELGADPGAALQELHQRILGGATAAGGGAGVEPVAVPRQLPAAPAPFVGRRDELDRLATSGAGTVVVSAVAGAGGIGKTWLTLHWAHRCAGRFPDGQLFVDLRGFSPEGPPMPAETALRGFLDALGVESGRVPVDPHAQAALFRSLVAGRRMLLVLDNAADTAQVAPLLPGSETCTVVVTSRNRLPGLITAHGARHLLLDVLPAPRHVHC
jgi:DNA-binding SARP family transcriptional activator